MLKEKMGWEMEDILYLNRMVSKSKTEPQPSLSESTKQKILQFQIIDRKIFAHFNASFDRHIHNIGEEKFYNLVEDFKRKRTEFEDSCFNKENELILSAFGTVSWNISEFGRTENRACEFLQSPDIALTHAVMQLQRSRDYQVEVEGKMQLQELFQWIQSDYESRRGTS